MRIIRRLLATLTLAGTLMAAGAVPASAIELPPMPTPTPTKCPHVKPKCDSHWMEGGPGDGTGGGQGGGGGQG
ncbi:hypothetical protein [Sphaerisporangium sp. TRM90804]|uniref:hypothetical protein n=1 Tax=Sphaerisporangium sp. TRM90804 TaxID=3031113 RepID=UPI00244C89FC|nr:hypothetical protein [Sphaerisporangium sp. TRM90804]MDH2427171.1 hypothetical protein [Sphaerisporangium sp. TRM90804]